MLAGEDGRTTPHESKTMSSQQKFEAKTSTKWA